MTSEYYSTRLSKKSFGVKRSFAVSLLTNGFTSTACLTQNLPFLGEELIDSSGQSQSLSSSMNRSQAFQSGILNSIAGSSFDHPSQVVPKQMFSPFDSKAPQQHPLDLSCKAAVQLSQQKVKLLNELPSTLNLIQSTSEHYHNNNLHKTKSRFPIPSQKIQAPCLGSRKSISRRKMSNPVKYTTPPLKRQYTSILKQLLASKVTFPKSVDSEETMAFKEPRAEVN